MNRNGNRERNFKKIWTRLKTFSICVWCCSLDSVPIRNYGIVFYTKYSCFYIITEIWIKFHLDKLKDFYIKRRIYFNRIASKLCYFCMSYINKQIYNETNIFEYGFCMFEMLILFVIYWLFS